MPTHLSGNSDPSCLRFSRLCRLAQLHEALAKSVIIESNYLEMLKHPEHGGTKFNFAESEVHLKPHLQNFYGLLTSPGPGPNSLHLVLYCHLKHN